MKRERATEEPFENIFILIPFHCQILIPFPLVIKFTGAYVYAEADLKNSSKTLYEEMEPFYCCSAYCILIFKIKQEKNKCK